MFSRETARKRSMINIKLLTADQLLLEAEKAVKNERLATAQVVKLFEEIYVRKLYLQRGYPSLFEMAVKHFGFCAGSAQRRINSMKLMRELPEIEEKIESGELSLTAASTLQGFFLSEKREHKTYSKFEKLSVVKSCLNKSTREVERELIALSPERDKKESATYINENRLRISLSISEELHQKINHLKSIWSHSNPSLSTEVLLERVVEMALQKVDPTRINERACKQKSRTQ
jgi:hypothetical protein